MFTPFMLHVFMPDIRGLKRPRGTASGLMWASLQELTKLQCGDFQMIFFIVPLRVAFLRNILIAFLWDAPILLHLYK